MATATKKPTAVGCAIYGGLFTVGVKAAGFQVLAHLEESKYGVDTALLNHPELQVYADGPTSWPEKFPRPIDLVYCNPPCAVWSPVSTTSISTTAKALAHWRDDPRLQHAYHAMDCVARYAPKVWIWESVPQALTRGRSLLLEMAALGRKHGYATTVVHFDAVTLGVPQRRPRVFVVLHKVAFEPGDVDHERVVTVKEAWRDLDRKLHPEVEKTSEQDLRLLPHVAPGVALRRGFDATFGDEGGRNARGQMIGRPAIPEKRLAFDRPGIPMLAKAWHPKLPRRITVGEALAIAQLPPSWQFGPSTRNATSRKELLQRAVMPKVGEWIAAAAFRAIKKARPAEVGPPLVYDLRRPQREVYELTGEAGRPAGPSKVDGSEPESTLRATSTPGRRPARPKDPRPPRERNPEAAAKELARAVAACRNLETGSGGLIRKRLIEGRSDDAILAEVHQAFPGRKTTKSDVAWNRRMLRLGGLLGTSKTNTTKEKTDGRSNPDPRGTAGPRARAGVSPAVQPAARRRAAAPRSGPAEIPDRAPAGGAGRVRGGRGKQ